MVNAQGTAVGHSNCGRPEVFGWLPGPDGATIEFAAVGVHDDMSAPE